MLPLLKKEWGGGICWTVFSLDSLSAEAKIAMNQISTDITWNTDAFTKKRSSFGLSGDWGTLLKCSSFNRLQIASTGERLPSWCAWLLMFRDKMFLPRVQCATQNDCFCLGCYFPLGGHIPYGLILSGGVIFFFLEMFQGNAIDACCAMCTFRIPS